MADNYIDYWEVAEYGGHFVAHARTLVGASPLVDMEQVSSLVAGAVAKVDSELEKLGMKRSSLRGGRSAMAAAIDKARKDTRRFFQFLGSIDAASLDVEAFFPGHQLGNISWLKPADLKARLDDMIRAFDLPANSSLPQGATWKATLTSTRDALDSALGSRGTASRQSRQATAGLRQARQEFLHVYNGVAKPITRGLLHALGRDHELKLFFADLQANESSRATTTPAETPATTPATTPETAINLA